MLKFLKNISDGLYLAVKWILTIIFAIIILVVLAGLIFISYNDLQASKAKDYLNEKYNFGKFDIIAYKTIEYVDKDTTDCSSLWLKKCTDDDNLFKESYFITKDKIKIHVTEYNDGTFVDDYAKEE